MALIAITKKGISKTPHNDTSKLPQVDASSFVLTPAASEHIKRMLAQDSTHKSTMLRLGIQGGGCSGFSYTFSLVDSAQENDHLFSNHGATVCIDPKSFRLLAGSLLDWQEHMKKAQFRIINPKAKTNCSCGKSFSV